MVDSTRFRDTVLKIRGRRRALRTWRRCAVLCDSWRLPVSGLASHACNVKLSQYHNLVAKALFSTVPSTTGILDIFFQAHREQKHAVLYCTSTQEQDSNSIQSPSVPASHPYIP